MKKLLRLLLLITVVVPLTGPGAQAGDKDSAPQVVLKTSMGDIVIELNREKAPKTVANFLTYVRSGYYDGTVFHRVIPRFMIQGGGFTPDMKKKKTGKPIQNEADNGLKNERGDDRHGPNPGSAQRKLAVFYQHRGQCLSRSQKQRQSWMGDMRFSGRL